MKLALAFSVLALAACGGKPEPAPVAPPVAAPAPAPAPAPPAEPTPGDDILAASKLAEQYEVGKEVYAKACASCHGDHGEGNPKNPAVIGDGFFPEKATFKGAKLRKTVAFITAKDVFDFIKQNMPLKKPGTLSDDEYLAVLAWMLNENKVALDKPVAADNLAAIKLR